MSTYRELLAEPSIRRSLIVQLIGPTAQSLWSVALVLVAIVELDSPAVGGIAALLNQLGSLLMPFAGAVLARFGERRTVLADLLVSTTCLVLMAVLAVSDHLSVASFLLLVTISGLTTQVAVTGMRTALLEQIPPELLDRANAAIFISRGIARLAGPAAAGFISALYDPATAVFVAAVLFVFAGCIVWFCPDAHPTASTFFEAWTDAKLGLTMVRTTPVIRKMSLFVVIAFLGWGTFFTAMPAMAKEDLGSNGSLVAWVYVCFSAADIISGILFGRRSTAGREFRLVALWGMIAGCGLLITANGSVVALLVGAAVIGACETPVDTAAYGARQRQVPAEALRHVMPFFMTIDFASAGLGYSLGGLLSEYSRSWALVTGGVLVLLASLYAVSQRTLDVHENG